MKLFELTGKVLASNPSYVEVKTTTGELTYAMFPLNAFFPLQDWIADNVKVLALCEYEKADTKECRPYIVELYPATKISALPTTETSYFKGGKRFSTDTAYNFVFGSSEVEITNEGKFKFGKGNRQPAVLGNDLTTALKDLSQNLQDLVNLLQQVSTTDSAAATTYGFAGYLGLAVQLPQITLGIAETNTNIKKILSQNIEIN
jgi:hypothetical protein